MKRGFNKELFDELGISIRMLESRVDNNAYILKSLKSESETDFIVAYKDLLKVSLMLDYISLDCMAAYRQYLSTELNTNYDKRQAIAKINVIMSEGYKKIYGFTTQQKQSFWLTRVKNAVDFIDGFEDEYNEIQDELENLKSVLNKDMRDLTVHYDEDPLVVYNMLISIDAEDIAKKNCKFLKGLERVVRLIWKI